MEKFKNGAVDIVKRTQLTSLLNGVLKRGEEVQLWQNVSVRRQKVKGQVSSVDIINGEIKICATQGSFTIFDNSDVYFFSAQKTMIFKSRIKRVSRLEVIISFPELAKIEEARMEKRVIYGYRSYQFADLSFVSFRDRKKLKLEKAKVMDSSANGMGILLSMKDGLNLKVGSKLITTEASVDSIRGRVGIVRSIIKNKNELTGEIMLRIGVELMVL